MATDRVTSVMTSVPHGLQVAQQSGTRDHTLRAQSSTPLYCRSCRLSVWILLLMTSNGNTASLCKATFVNETHKPRPADPDDHLVRKHTQQCRCTSPERDASNAASRKQRADR